MWIIVVWDAGRKWYYSESGLQSRRIDATKYYDYLLAMEYKEEAEKEYEAAWVENF